MISPRWRSRGSATFTPSTVAKRTRRTRRSQARRVATSKPSAVSQSGAFPAADRRANGPPRLAHFFNWAGALAVRLAPGSNLPARSTVHARIADLSRVRMLRDRKCDRLVAPCANEDGNAGGDSYREHSLNYDLPSNDATTLAKALSCLAHGRGFNTVCGGLFYTGGGNLKCRSVDISATRSNPQNIKVNPEPSFD